MINWRVYCAVVSLILVLFVERLSCGGNHPVPTYFQRRDNSGQIIDRRNATFGSDIFKPIIEQKYLSNTVQINIYPSIIDNSGIIELSWKANNPNKYDWIGFYCHPDLNHELFLDYFLVRELENNSGGRGFKNLQVYNVRENCEFRYFHVKQNISVFAARSNLLRFTQGKEAPIQGHLALTGNPSEMKVTWTSGSEVPPLVIYGLKSQELVMNSTGNSTTYSAEDMCGAPANGPTFLHPGNIFSVVMKHLKPKTTYFYRFGDGKIMSKIFHFTTSFAREDKSPYSFIVYGDMGLTGPPGAITTMKLMDKEIEERNAKFIWHIGDLSYGCGMGYIWEQWHALIEPAATRVPYMVGIGNHEQDHTAGGERDPSGAPGQGFHPLWGNFENDSGGECGVPMFHRFKMPENGNSLWWYSFDYGMVHYVMMSTEHDFLPGSQQYKWIKNDLENVDRSVTPWVIFSGHRAMYCSDKLLGDFVVSTYLRKALEDVLLENKVNLALWGHYHAYERTCFVKDNKCVDENEGLTHITIGTAGMFLNSGIWIPRPWSLVRNTEFGYGRVTIANSTAMLFEFIHNKDENVRDQVWIYQ